MEKNATCLGQPFLIQKIDFHATEERSALYEFLNDFFLTKSVNFSVEKKEFHLKFDHKRIYIFFYKSATRENARLNFHSGRNFIEAFFDPEKRKCLYLGDQYFIVGNFEHFPAFLLYHPVKMQIISPNEEDKTWKLKDNFGFIHKFPAKPAFGAARQGNFLLSDKQFIPSTGNTKKFNKIVRELLNGGDLIEGVNSFFTIIKTNAQSMVRNPVAPESKHLLTINKDREREKIPYTEIRVEFNKNDKTLCIFNREGDLLKRFLPDENKKVSIGPPAENVRKDLFRWLKKGELDSKDFPVGALKPGINLVPGSQGLGVVLNNRNVLLYKKRKGGNGDNRETYDILERFHIPKNIPFENLKNSRGVLRKVVLNNYTYPMGFTPYAAVELFCNINLAPYSQVRYIPTGKNKSMRFDPQISIPVQAKGHIELKGLNTSLLLTDPKWKELRIFFNGNFRIKKIKAIISERPLETQLSPVYDNGNNKTAFVVCNASRGRFNNFTTSTIGALNGIMGLKFNFNKKKGIFYFNFTKEGGEKHSGLNFSFNYLNLPPFLRNVVEGPGFDESKLDFFCLFEKGKKLALIPVYNRLIYKPYGFKILRAPNGEIIYSGDNCKASKVFRNIKREDLKCRVTPKLFEGLEKMLSLGSSYIYYQLLNACYIEKMGNQLRSVNKPLDLNWLAMLKPALIREGYIKPDGMFRKSLDFQYTTLNETWLRQLKDKHDGAVPQSGQKGDIRWIIDLKEETENGITGIFHKAPRELSLEQTQLSVLNKVDSSGDPKEFQFMGRLFYCRFKHMEIITL